jgi:outer membrane protein TolC
MWKWLGVLFLLSGCYVNRASYDPFSYAPDQPYCPWSPDDCAGRLACQGSSLEECLPDLPPEDHQYTLAELIDIGLYNSPTTQSSWAEARQAAAQYGLSQATAFPDLSAEFFHTHSRTSYLSSQVNSSAGGEVDSVIASSQVEWGPQLNLTYTLFDFGQRRATSEAARYLLYFADYTHNRTIQTLLETVTIDYYNLLYQEQLLEANEADLVDAMETLDAAELGLREGVKDISDMLQARTQMLQAKITLEQQKQTVSTAKATLLDDLGLAANRPLKLAKMPRVDLDEASLSPLEEYLACAQQSRPDLIASRAVVVSKAQTLKATQVDWLPKVDYSLEFGRTYWGVGLNDRYNYNSTFTISMPLFKGFWYRNSIKQARAGLELAESELRQTETDVIADVTTAHFNVGIAKQTLLTSAALLASAKEQYKVSKAQYRQGTTTILDLISAQAALFDARAVAAQALNQWFTSLATLSYSAGIISKKPEETP